MNRYETILSAAELAIHRADPDWVIIDCRFDLSQPDWGAHSYQQQHIPGAHYAHLDQDLSGPITLHSGRHPLPPLDDLTRRLQNWGVGDDTQVVVYDTSGGAFAGRLWWLLHYLGHNAAAVLDGGLAAWLRAGLPVSATPTPLPAQAGSFTPHSHPEMLVSADDVEQLRQQPAYRLVDARAPERYRGEQEPIDPVAGHIPGALNRFHGDNLDEYGQFLPVRTLREQFTNLLGAATPSENVIVYCGSGVTSAHHVLAMQVAGLSGARLYAGSWSEWIRDEKRPIA